LAPLKSLGQVTQAILVDQAADVKQNHPGMQIRMAGDCYILVEYGAMTLDLCLRVRIHLLEQSLLKTDPIGLEETAPGVRSLQIRYDPTILPLPHLLELITCLDSTLGDASKAQLPTRVFHLPMAWDHSGVQSALNRYMQSVRPEAPYLPRNIDFIAANNGLTVEDVHAKVFRASYMCMGLGDVYLGACCATPVDPRDRVVVPKFNPARTYTQEGTVGLGGAYMCIYPMDSPGGYQLVGRTLPIWNTWGLHSPSIFSPDKPWMLQMFDQIRFYEVPEAELETLRAQFKSGDFEPRVTQEIFDLVAYSEMLASIDTEVQTYQQQQRTSAAAQNVLEQASLARIGDLQTHDTLDTDQKEVGQDYVLGEGESFVYASLGAKVWEFKAGVGEAVQANQTVVVLEAMKMEINVEAEAAGILKQYFVKEGDLVRTGQKIGLLQANSS
jgi:urea carboxylase